MKVVLGILEDDSLPDGGGLTEHAVPPDTSAQLLLRCSPPAISIRNFG